MRVLTDARRQAILDAAASLFQDLGYERTSMAQISSHLGGSKATLYNYFGSKEELFAAVMTKVLEGQAKRLLDIVSDDTGGIRAILDRFADAYVAFIALPEILSINRLSIAEGAASKLGRTLYASGPLHAWGRIAEMLDAQMRSGGLRTADPLLAAYHLKGLLETGLLEPTLFGAGPVLPAALVARTAVDVFLAAYGPQADVATSRSATMAPRVDDATVPARGPGPAIDA